MAGQVFLPVLYFTAQAFDIERRKGVFRASKVSVPAVEDRFRAAKVTARFVMEGNRNLHQSLEVPLGRARRRQFAPEVFERLVGVEETGPVKEAKSVIKIRLGRRH